MGIKLERKKKANYLGSFAYRFNRILPLSAKAKFKLFLNLEWIFERFAHEYSSKYYLPAEHPFRLHTKKTLLDFIKEDQAVLDLGCKAGEMSIYIAEKAKLVVGVDFDKKAISVAQNNYHRDNLTFVCSDAYEYLNKSQIKFDVLILSHILEHLDDPEAFLKRYTPFFKFIYIELPDFEKSHLNKYRKDLNLKLIYTDDDHISEFDRDELSTLITKCGLQIITAEYRYGLQKIWCKVV
jgi:ubiquinone/menaquinone biosynthesis C-methylase UbiE